MGTKVIPFQKVLSNYSGIPKLDLEPVKAAQRKQNLEENTELIADGLNLKERKLIRDKLGLVSAKRDFK